MVHFEAVALLNISIGIITILYQVGYMKQLTNAMLISSSEFYSIGGALFYIHFGFLIGCYMIMIGSLIQLVRNKRITINIVKPVKVLSFIVILGSVIISIPPVLLIFGSITSLHPPTNGILIYITDFTLGITVLEALLPIHIIILIFLAACSTIILNSILISNVAGLDFNSEKLEIFYETKSESICPTKTGNFL